MSVNSHTLLQPPVSHQLTQENAQKRKNNKTKIAETNFKGCYILKEHPEGATIS